MDELEKLLNLSPSRAFRSGIGDATGETRSPQAAEQTPSTSAPDPFAMLGPARSEPKPAQATDAERDDVLDALIQESEAALRDPNYVSPFSQPLTGRSAPAIAAEPQFDALAADFGAGSSLLQALAGRLPINTLIGPLGDLEALELPAASASDDVLWLFAGDIVPTRRRDVTAELTRREHHLVSMDSAYRPALASPHTSPTGEHGHDGQ
ncbi:TagK domain-containing protein [Cupriavidus basilensis]|uniref:TagK domain-containing protein n=1 Tax=Cupriavidus basilensis TaxID=68895 RepID=UPI0039F6C11B